jgi:hypothetical protein
MEGEENSTGMNDVNNDSFSNGINKRNLFYESKKPIVKIPAQTKKSKSHLYILIVILFIALLFSIYYNKFHVNEPVVKNESCLDYAVFATTFNKTDVTLILKGVNGTCYDMNNQSLRLDYIEPFIFKGMRYVLRNDTGVKENGK